MRGAGRRAAGARRRGAAASGPGTVVTDVGSTKRELVASVGDSGERFIGGHPLAGAETSGVENARADLFEGARWYLTPTPRAEGVLYDRLQRTIAELGARPQAIDAETHDRLMATVSHLPHVLANVLAAQAAEALAGDAERLPEVGPSFRDTTRVAGANPAIWADIFASNSDAVAGRDRGRDRAPARRRGAAALRRRRSRGAVAPRGRPPAPAPRCSRPALVGGPLRELRIAVPNRPGIVAELALALGRAGVNIEDMALAPAADMRSGAVSLWVAGDEEAQRAAGHVRALGHSVAVIGRASEMAHGASTRPGRCAASCARPRDKSISHRAAILAAMAEGGTLIENLPRRRRHPLDAGGRSVSSGAQVGSPDERGELASAASALPARAPPPRIDVGNAGTLLRMLPGWLAGQHGGRWRSTATSRSAAARSTASSSRWGRWAPGRLPRTDACRRCGSRRRRCAASHDAAGGQRPGEVVPAARGAARRRQHDRDRAGADARSHRADASAGAPGRRSPTTAPSRAAASRSSRPITSRSSR